jgi:hypothetical protein
MGGRLVTDPGKLAQRALELSSKSAVRLRALVSERIGFEDPHCRHDRDRADDEYSGEKVETGTPHGRSTPATGGGGIPLGGGGRRSRRPH